jgi:hypothetical protein
MWKRLFPIILCFATTALAQERSHRAAAEAPQPKWRQSLLSLPKEPPANTRPQDVYRVERNLRSALPYFANAQPADYEANRELVRRVTVYLAGLQVLAQDREMRQAVGRIQRTMGLLPYFAATVPTEGSAPQPAPEPPAPATENRPPFSLSPPTLPQLNGEAKASADSLSARYEGAAARALSAWQNAEQLRLSLATQGAVLNTQTAADVARLEIYFDSASKALLAQNWEAAQTELERAEYTTERILKVVGR